jgi:hypothetical protein
VRQTCGDEQLRVDEFCLFLVSWLTSSVTPPQSGLSCDNPQTEKRRDRPWRCDDESPSDQTALEFLDAFIGDFDFQWFVSAHSQPPWMICHTRPLPTCQPLRVSDDMSRSVAELGNQKASTSRLCRSQRSDSLAPPAVIDS